MDEGLAAARPTRDPVRPPQPSAEGRRKKREHVTVDGHRLHSLPTLLASMGSLTRATLRMAGGAATFDRDATPTPWQHAVLQAARGA